MEKRHHIKDPGSAITHFIGMLMAIFAAVPLLIKAAHEPSRIYIGSLTVYAISLILLYAASTTYHTFDISPKVNTILKKNRSYDDLRPDRRKLYTGMPPCSKRDSWHHASLYCMGICDCRHIDQGILGVLSEMDLLCPLHWYGMDLCSGFFSDPQ